MIIQSDFYDAYYNLALEEYIFKYLCQEDRYILFLWQNDNAVIIGRNQNAGNECDFSAMKKYGTKLVRRNTGGGAVYHDMGNLNFSVCCPREHYNEKRSIGIVKKAITELGVEPEYSGRNDLLVQGKKISGNAFLTSKKSGLHHGTVLLHTDLKVMREVLRVSEKKLQPKGIDSILSRVINLETVCPSATVENVKKKIIQKFMEEYDHDHMEYVDGTCLRSYADNETFRSMVEKYSSELWNMGEHFHYNHVRKERFSWGQCEIRILTEKEKIARIAIYTDSLFPLQITETEKRLRGMALGQLKEEDVWDQISKQAGLDIFLLKDIRDLIIMCVERQ